MRRVAIFACVIIGLGLVHAQTPPEPVDHAAIAALKLQGFQSSQVVDTLSWLTDVHGPRLSGSPNLRAAGEWARDQLTRWGFEGAALEAYGDFGRGWSVERFSVEMREPQYVRVIAIPAAWSPAIATPIVGTPVQIDVDGPEDFDKYRGTLRGKIVMNGRAAATPPGFEPLATRYDDEELANLAEQINPASEALDAPKSYWAEDESWKKEAETDRKIVEFLASEGIAVLLEPSERAHGVVRVSGFDQGLSTREWKPPYPAFKVAREHFGRIVRLLERKQAVTLELSLDSRFHEHDALGFNVVAEIPGTDPKLRDEVVMLGAHLDSWHAGTGATDNAAGSAVVMEAARLIKAAGLTPRRTIRVALWTGEEQGYWGSLAYVERHFADLETMALRPGHRTLAAYFNVDNGTGRIRGVNLQGNEAVRPIFEAWLGPFHYLGAETLTTLNTGGTDHMPFDAVGLPGFQFIQDPIAYSTRTHHTNLDVYEAVVEDDLKQASVILASFVYHAAARDAMLPRKPLPKPRAAGGGGPGER